MKTIQFAISDRELEILRRLSELKKISVSECAKAFMYSGLAQWYFDKAEATLTGKGGE